MLALSKFPSARDIESPSDEIDAAGVEQSNDHPQTGL